MNTIEITTEEYRTLVEAQVKLDTVARFFKSDSLMNRSEFYRITGINTVMLEGENDNAGEQDGN